MYAEKSHACTMTEIQEGRAPLYSTALTMFQGRSYVIKPNFHNNDLVQQPITTNLDSGNDMVINVPKAPPPTNEPIANARTQASAPVPVKGKPQLLKVVATSAGVNAAGQPVKVLKVVKSIPKPSSNAEQFVNNLENTYAKDNSNTEPQSPLDVLAKVAIINMEKKEQAIGDPNLVTNLQQREGQNAMVAMQPGFTATEKEKIQAKNLGTCMCKEH